jgi:hypothetical protein
MTVLLPVRLLSSSLALWTISTLAPASWKGALTAWARKLASAGRTASGTVLPAFCSASRPATSACALASGQVLLPAGA